MAKAKNLMTPTEWSLKASSLRIDSPRRSIAALTAFSCGLSTVSQSIVVCSFLAGAMNTTASPGIAANNFNHVQRVFIPPGKRYESLTDTPGPEGTDLYNTQGASVVKTTTGGRTFNKTIINSETNRSGHTGGYSTPNAAAAPNASTSSTSSTSSKPSSSSVSSAPSSSAAGGTHPGATPAMNAFINQARARAQALVKQGKLADAEQMLEKDVQIIQNNQTLQHELADVKVARARFSLKAGNTTSATKFAEGALAVQPDHAAAKQLLDQIENKSTATTASIDTHLTKARVLAAEAHFTEAQQEIQTAMHIRDTADVRVALGDLALQQNNKVQAKIEYSKALHLDPKSSAALRQTGILKLEDNDVAGANKDLGQALMIDPKDKEAASALQKIWHAQVAKNPTSATAHLGLARAYQLSGELTLAQVEYKEVAKIDPSNPALPAARQSFKMALAKQEVCHCLEAAQTLEKAGALDEAHQKILEAIAISPHSLSARIYQGTICEKLALYPEAHDAFMQALRVDPKNAVAAKHLRQLASLPGGSAIARASGPAGTAPQRSKTIAQRSDGTTGMYVFRGWQYPHPLANSSNADVNSPQYQYMMATQNSSQMADGISFAAGSAGGYGAGGAPGSLPNGSSYGGAPPMSPATTGAAGLAAPAALSLPGAPVGSYPVDPANPMPLQGVPPTAAPAPPVQGATTTNHINQISSFLSNWKNAYTQTKKQVQNAVDAAQAMEAVSSGGSSSAGLSSLGGLSAGNSSGLAAALAAGKDSSAAAAPPLQTNSIDSILKQAKAAIAKAGGPSSASASSAVAASDAPGPAAASSASGAAGNAVNINVNGTNIQITTPSRGSASAGGTEQAASARGMSSAMYDALPASFKKAFPDVSQQDFSTIVADLKAPLKNVLAHARRTSPQASQSVAAQLEPAGGAAGSVPQSGIGGVDGGINDSTVASALSNLSASNPALANDVAAIMKRNNITPAMVSQALSQTMGGSFPAGAGIPVGVPAAIPTGVGQPGSMVALDDAEKEMIAKAGQDVPTMPPPEVIPAEAAPVALQAPAAQSLNFPATPDSSQPTALAALNLPSSFPSTSSSVGSTGGSTPSGASTPVSSSPSSLAAERLKIGPSGSIDSPSSTTSPSLSLSALVTPSAGSLSSATSATTPLTPTTKTTPATPTTLTALSPIMASPTGEPAIAPVNGMPPTAPSTVAPGMIPPVAPMAPPGALATALRTPLTPVNNALSRADLQRNTTPPDAVVEDNSNSAVVFELQGFDPTPTGVRLRVILRNSRSQTLPVPGDIKAVVHMPGKSDRTAHVTFAAREVQANGEITGVVKIAGHDLSPAADLVLADFLPPTFSERDVHLTVPISALMKFAPK